MKPALHTGQVIASVAVILGTERLDPALRLPVVAIGIVLVGLVVMLLNFRTMSLPLPALVRVPAPEVDPLVRARAEGVLRAHLMDQPGWGLYGWVRGATGKADTLIASDGRSYAYVHHLQGVGPVSLVSAAGERLFWCYGTSLRTLFWLSPNEPWEHCVVGRPTSELLRLHAAQTAGATLDPIPDPVEHLDRLLRTEHERGNGTWGRYRDGAGNGRLTWAGALAALWRYQPLVRVRLARQENARADNLIRRAETAPPSRRSTPQAARTGPVAAGSEVHDGAVSG